MITTTSIPQTATAKEPKPLFHSIGLDLGQMKDYTAIAIAECTDKFDQEKKRWQRHIVIGYLERWPQMTPYTEIVRDVANLVGRDKIIKPPILSVDQTGVGAPVVDMIRHARLNVQLRPIMITGGSQVNRGDDGSWHVPKKELVAVLQVALQERRLQVANVPDREILIKEMQNFRVKITASANETFEAWREGQHDDLVLAVALAVWSASRQGAGPGGQPMTLGRMPAWYTPGPGRKG